MNMSGGTRVREELESHHEIDASGNEGNEECSTKGLNTEPRTKDKQTMLRTATALHEARKGVLILVSGSRGFPCSLDLLSANL